MIVLLVLQAITIVALVFVIGMLVLIPRKQLRINNDLYRQIAELRGQSPEGKE